MTVLAFMASLAYMLAFAASGWFLARLLLPRDRFMRRLLFGLTAGLVMLLWLPVLAAFVMDFTLAAQLVALAIACGIGVLSILLYNKKLRNDKDLAFAISQRPRFDFKKELPLILTCVPLMVLGTVLLLNHTITSASDGSLHVGQCTYGDLCMHLGFISSISVQKTFPPMYSILPGTPLGYPFLCDSVSSTFCTLGASLRAAAILPAVYAYVVVVLGVHLFFEQWFKRSSVTVIATLLFFIGGGFGFAYFFDNAKTYSYMTSGAAWSNWLSDTYHVNAYFTGDPAAPDMINNLMHGFYNTPTNYSSLGLRWVNSIADMLVPQRATLFGWALLFPSLQLLHRAAFEKENKLFIYLGVLAGAMPLVHTHSFFALGIISVFLIGALLIRKLAGRGCEGDGKMLLFFLLFGVIAVVLAAPQLFGFTFRQSSSGGFIKYHWNWCNTSDSWLWFYIKNLGLIFILMPIAFLFTKGENKLFYGGGLLIWAICEFIVFQPNTYDNNKLLFVWFALTCGIVAEFTMTLFDRLGGVLRGGEEEITSARRLSVNAGRVLLLAVMICSMTLSGVMTLAREYVSGDHLGIENGGLKYKESGYQVVSPGLVKLAEYINENAAPDATFLTATNHNNAVAMLTGRNVVCGADTFLYFHGVDYQQREADVKRMYEQPSAYFSGLAELYDVDYVLISSWERGSFNIDQEYFTRFETVFESDGILLYRVGR